VFCIYLRTNSDLCHLQLKLIGFYNRDEKYLQRGTDWAFNYSGLHFVCKACWLRDASKRLTCNNYTFCSHCIYVICIYLKIGVWIVRGLYGKEKLLQEE